jgi:hypothetical protein
MRWKPTKSLRPGDSFILTQSAFTGSQKTGASVENGSSIKRSCAIIDGGHESSSCCLGVVAAISSDLRRQDVSVSAVVHVSAV